MQWKYKMEVGDLHRKYQRGELTPKELGTEIAKRIRSNAAYKNIGELKAIAKSFAGMKANATVKTYDNILNRLYNVGDFYGIWIESF